MNSLERSLVVAFFNGRNHNTTYDRIRVATGDHPLILWERENTRNIAALYPMQTPDFGGAPYRILKVFLTLLPGGTPRYYSRLKALFEVLSVPCPIVMTDSTSSLPTGPVESNGIWGVPYHDGTMWQFHPVHADRPAIDYHFATDGAGRIIGGQILNDPREAVLEDRRGNPLANERRPNLEERARANLEASILERLHRVTDAQQSVRPPPTPEQRLVQTLYNLPREQIQALNAVQLQQLIQLQANHPTLTVPRQAPPRHDWEASPMVHENPDEDDDSEE